MAYLFPPRLLNIQLVGVLPADYGRCVDLLDRRVLDTRDPADLCIRVFNFEFEKGQVSSFLPALNYQHLSVDFLDP